MQLNLDMENASSEADISLPSTDEVHRWLKLCLQHPEFSWKTPCLSIRIVDEDESRELNKHYRHKDKATNVLSFPCELAPEVELELLGDIVICAQVVAREAEEQGKSLHAHWAHMVIHGCLHLAGYDHIEEEEANIMEALETRLLTELGFSTPYER